MDLLKTQSIASTQEDKEENQKLLNEISLLKSKLKDKDSILIDLD